jgi:hypothetical protein
MKILNQDGFSQSELKSFRVPVFKSLERSVLGLIHGMESLNIKFQNETNQVQFRSILEVKWDKNGTGLMLEKRRSHQGLFNRGKRLQMGSCGSQPYQGNLWRPCHDGGFPTRT